jgi:hypothetical protein
MNNTDNNQLRARVAALETQVDMLESELTHLHEMLVRCGFSNGIETLKETVEEYLSEEYTMPKQQQS